MRDSRARVAPGLGTCRENSGVSSVLALERKGGRRGGAGEGREGEGRE